MTQLSQLGANYDVRLNGTRPQPGVLFSYTGADWFGPLLPMQPIAPPEVAGRSWDFTPGYNLTTEPRAYEPVSFGTLRSLADAYDPLRLVIERRKDQMTRLPWAIRLKHDDPGRKRPRSAQLSAATRERIRDLTEFFKRPTHGLNFRSWLRMLLEDHFVIDAASIFCERDRSGLIGLRPVDGALIKVVIDDWGGTPRPIVWSGQPFDWNGQTVTAENFVELGFVYEGGFLWPPAYQFVLKNLPALNYTTRDLIYRPLNLRTGHVYGRSPVECIVSTVSTAMRRSFSQLEYFREGNQPEAIYSLPASWTPDQVQRFQDYWDSLYSGNLANRRRMKFLSGDGKYQALKEPPLKNEFDEWLVRIVCFAFSYPPSAFVSLSNRSIAEQHERTAEEEGLEPTKLWFSDLANEVMEDEFGVDDLEFAWVEEQEIDQERQSKILTRYAESGAITLNQLREKIGEDPDPDPAANRLMVRTPTGYVPIGPTDESTNLKGAQQ